MHLNSISRHQCTQHIPGIWNYVLILRRFLIVTNPEMKSTLNIVIFLVAITMVGKAQNSIIVKDAESNKPLEGASILLHDSQDLSITDFNGVASGFETGAKVHISYVGYTPKEIGIKTGINYVYLEADYQVLNTLTVIGYENERKLGDIAGSFAVASRLAMERFSDESLVRSMNTLPGIRFEERSPASYRISIRGSLLRAPFGVRNVKVYWNDIPYTDPNGNTPINMLDLNNIGRVETIKGPSGSIYGAGMGGVLSIYSEPPRFRPVSAEMGYMAGSFGLNKVYTNVYTGNEDHAFTVRYARQAGDGYRDHTNFDRTVFQMSGRFFTSEKRTISAQVLFSDLFYQTPGGLTKAEYDANPRQARPLAEARNSSIDQQNFMAGVVQDYEWNTNVKNTTSLFISNGIKENPFINNYELEKLNSFGGRSVFNFDSELFQLPVRYTAGAELNVGNFHASSHGNVNGYADTLRYEDELKSIQTFAFAQADIQISSKWSLVAGASINYLRYNIDRIRDVALDTSYAIHREFNPEFVPRVGLLGKLNQNMSFHASVSTGFSPPTSEEIRTSDGAINDGLEAERGINYEIGIRGGSKNEKFYYDLTAFLMMQRETIVSKTNEFGTVTFDNAGSTDQPGVEVLLGYALINNPAGLVSLLKVQTSYTYHHFRFKDYVKLAGGENVDYSGNQLTGTAPHISVTTIDFTTRSGYYLNFTYNFTDKIPLNDANTVFADSYNLITSKTGWKLNIKNKHILDFYFGIDNLLNEKYSLGNDLNAFGQRYFNVSPERNYFAGVKVNLNK